MPAADADDAAENGGVGAIVHVRRPFAVQFEPVRDEPAHLRVEADVLDVADRLAVAGPAVQPRMPPAAGQRASAVATGQRGGLGGRVGLLRGDLRDQQQGQRHGHGHRSAPHAITLPEQSAPTSNDLCAHTGQFSVGQLPVQSRPHSVELIAANWKVSSFAWRSIEWSSQRPSAPRECAWARFRGRTGCSRAPCACRCRWRPPRANPTG